MKWLKTMHLKLIMNSSYYKDKFSFPIINKDYYLYDLINRKRKGKIEDLIISQNDIIQKSKIKIKIKKFFNYLNINDKFKNFSQTIKKRAESSKNIDTDLNILFKKKVEKRSKFNTTKYIKLINNENFVKSKNIKNSLIITPLSKSNSNFIAKKNKRKNNLTKFKKSYTTMNFKENEKEEILKNSFLSITPIKKNQLFKSKKIKKISEGTQINTDYLFNEIKFVNNKHNSAINMYKYFSPNSIRYQKELKKMKSVEFYYRYE